MHSQPATLTTLALAADPPRSEPASAVRAGATDWRWSRPALGAIVLLAAFLNLFRLDHEGYSNSYYAAAIKGAIVLRLERHGGQVQLQVQDSGPGIEPRHLPHLFDRFYRADHARYEGTGLGLAIARWIAEAHGGHIAGANAPRGGALFTVTLPANRVP